MGLDAKTVLKGLRNPLKAVGYLRYRVRDLVTAGRLAFDSDSVSGADTFPALCKELYVETRLIAQILGDTTAERSLEVGCGFGRLTPWIADYSEDHYAIEPEKSLMESAREMTPEVSYANTTAKDLPYPDEHFDLLVSWTVLMHVPNDRIESVVDELVRVSADDGKIILAEKTGDQFETGRSFTRSATEYEILFDPFELTGSTPRPMEAGGWTTSHEVTVMRFEKEP